MLRKALAVNIRIYDELAVRASEYKKRNPSKSWTDVFVKGLKELIKEEKL